MAISFFEPWALWAKMSFVLAVAIIAVFLVGFGKLLWMNRSVKRREGRDEEERMRMEVSGPMAETRKSQDIPFGIRAIQSGIQVDGIWQSEDSLPLPANLKFGHKGDSKNSGSRTPSPRGSLDTSQVAQPASSRGRSSLRAGEGVLVSSQQGTGDPKAGEAIGSRASRPSYKPRRSSHLRYHSHGNFDVNEIKVHEPESEAASMHEGRIGIKVPEIEEDTLSGGVADNERSSGSETDLTLPINMLGQTRVQRKSLPAQLSHETYLSEPTKVSNTTTSLRASLPLQSSDFEYFAIPLDHCGPGTSKPDASALLNDLAPTLPPRPPYAQTAGELTAHGESQVPLLSNSRSQSPFIPGELHMNKTVRKVNSGFEVLPAGTFGVPTNNTGKSVEGKDRWKQDDDTGEKRNKLQKKPRTSMSSHRRSSSTFESPR